MAERFAPAQASRYAPSGFRMSLHTSGIVINIGRPIDPKYLLGQFGLNGKLASETISVSNALSLGPNDGLAIASVREWSVVFGSALYMPMVSWDGKPLSMGPGFNNIIVQGNLERLCADGGKAFTFIAEGASMTYGFEWYDQVLQRRYLEIDGEESVNEGEILEDEQSIFDETDDQEERIWNLMKRWTISLEEGNSAQYSHFLNVKGA
ncbi:MAG: hypothetical protein QY326_03345 [Bdellovibrionota bacterium]|nr:MAG: hypothetical protein QY326_03345 [Bdellovibrionota bacterium]